AVVRQFEHGIAQFQIANLQAATGGLTKVMFEAKVPFIESHRAVKVGDMNGHMIDALEHGFLLGLKHRLFVALKARVMHQCEIFRAWRYNVAGSESHLCRYFALSTILYSRRRIMPIPAACWR